MTKISCCMISWNEHRTIDLALKSIAGFADEIMIADNGSFDGTVEVARKLLRSLRVPGRVMRVKSKTLGQGRKAAWDKCSEDWILLLDSNQVLSNALKRELKTCLRNRNIVGCVKSLNLMGDYAHYFSGLRFHAHHAMFFHRDMVRWRTDRDRPDIKHQSGARVVTMNQWAVNLSRVRPAWRCWYRGEPFDKRFYKPNTSEAFRTKTNLQDGWVTSAKYGNLVDFIKAKSGLSLADVKKRAPEWYLKQLREYALPLEPDFKRFLPEVIKQELVKPRYRLIYGGGEIIGRYPEL